MTDKPDMLITEEKGSAEEIQDFAESYASFNRIVNSLQRKYIDLKDEYSLQNVRLTDVNQQLLEMTARNLAATEFLDSILGAMGAGVIAVDQSGRITHFNRAAATLLGLRAEEQLGKAYRDVLAPGKPAWANALRTVESSRAVEAVEKIIELTDGTRLFLSVSTSIMRDTNGRPTGAVEVFHDLTKIKRLEQEVARLNTLAALGEMAAAVAHQVRNPLSGILGYGSLLKRDLPVDDPRQKLVEQITAGVEALNNTVTALLNYTRKDELNRELIDLRAFLETCVTQFRRDRADLTKLLEVHVRRSDRPGADPGDVMIDPVLFGQVITNLLTNAGEAMTGSGEVIMATELLPRLIATERYAKQLMLGLDETVVEITVTDSGPGIPKDIIDKLFVPFFSTKDGGNGLGLAVAWKIIRAHGGEIVAAESKSGARFVILLPVKLGGASQGSA